MFTDELQSFVTEFAGKGENPGFDSIGQTKLFRASYSLPSRRRLLLSGRHSRRMPPDFVAHHVCCWRRRPQKFLLMETDKTQTVIWQ